jgi:hypothetical protein
MTSRNLLQTLAAQNELLKDTAVKLGARDERTDGTLQRKVRASRIVTENPIIQKEIDIHTYYGTDTTLAGKVGSSHWRDEKRPVGPWDLQIHDPDAWENAKATPVPTTPDPRDGKIHDFSHDQYNGGASPITPPRLHGFERGRTRGFDRF